MADPMRTQAQKELHRKGQQSDCFVFTLKNGKRSGVKLCSPSDDVMSENTLQILVINSSKILYQSVPIINLLSICYILK